MLSMCFCPALRVHARRAPAEMRSAEREMLDLFFEYFWSSICAQPLSSDKWVNAFLVPLMGGDDDDSGLYARRPIADEPPERLAALPPCTVIYGERDWVMTPSALEAAKRLPGGHLHLVRGGNHHLYFDMPDVFHRLAAQALA